jgi:hypothetical protein
MSLLLNHLLLCSRGQCTATLGPVPKLGRQLALLTKLVLGWAPILQLIIRLAAWVSSYVRILSLRNVACRVEAKVTKRVNAPGHKTLHNWTSHSYAAKWPKMNRLWTILPTRAHDLKWNVFPGGLKTRRRRSLGVEARPNPIRIFPLFEPNIRKHSMFLRNWDHSSG